MLSLPLVDWNSHPQTNFISSKHQWLTMEANLQTNQPPVHSFPSSPLSKQLKPAAFPPITGVGWPEKKNHPLLELLRTTTSAIFFELITAVWTAITQLKTDQNRAALYCFKSAWVGWKASQIAFFLSHIPLTLYTIKADVFFRLLDIKDSCSKQQEFLCFSWEK